MRSDNASFSHSVEALRELFHTLRTPLGVALTIAKDSQKGLPLTQSDHQDAVYALERIRDSLDELKPLLNMGKLDCVWVDTDELSSICELEGYKLEDDLYQDTKFYLDSSLIKVWLRSFYSALDGKKVIALKQIERQSTLSIKFDNSDRPRPSQSFCQLLSGAFDSIAVRHKVSDLETTLVFLNAHF